MIHLTKIGKFLIVHLLNRRNKLVFTATLIKSCLLLTDNRQILNNILISHMLIKIIKVLMMNQSAAEARRKFANTISALVKARRYLNSIDHN